MGKESGIKAGEVISKVGAQRKGMKRGLSVIDLILRIVAGVATLASAIIMGTANQTLPFASQFVQFSAEFDDLPSFVFFVLANSLVCGYLALSLVLSIFHIVKSTAVKSRILLVFLDTAAMGFLTAAAAAAAAIVEIAHHGNPSANWFAICQQYDGFCERTSGALIGSFIGVAVFIILIFISAVSISRS